ncbi:amino acid permease [Phenylobacterium sp. LjRoot225]|uniref:amino acid permease n=1 Tax=Phenylobacterium sp. LjRoot225 TaxID=3342285 RepID=UPI003ECD8DDD
MEDEAQEGGAGGLRRQLQSRHLAMISVGGIIGSGLFVGSSAAIAAAGPAVVVSYALAGVLVLFVMRMLGEMAALSPDAGSFTEYIRQGLGNGAGFIAGWLYWYFWVLALAVEALSGAAILHGWLGLPIWQIGFGLLLLLTFVNLMSARVFGEAEFWLSAAKLTALIAFILLGGAWLAGWIPSPAAPSPGLASTLAGHGGFAPLGWGAMFACITTVIFALVGAEIVTVAAAESREPERTIARLTTSLVIRLGLFFVLSMLVVVSIVPWTEIHPGASPFAMALDRIGIPGVAGIMNLVVLIAVTSCLNAGFYVSSRVLFALAREGDAPRWMVRLNPRGVPVGAVLAGSGVACLALVGAISFPDAIFAFLVNASGVVMLVIYLMLALAQIRHRRRVERDAPQRLTFRVWFFPYSSYAVLAAIVAILLAMTVRPDLRAQLWSGLALTAAIFLLWAIRRARSAAPVPAVL